MREPTPSPRRLSKLFTALLGRDLSVSDKPATDEPRQPSPIYLRLPLFPGRSERLARGSTDEWSSSRTVARSTIVPATACAGKQALPPCDWRFAGLAVGRPADLLSAARGAHDAGESRVAVRGVGSAARGDRHARNQQRSTSQRATPRGCRWSSWLLHKAVCENLACACGERR